MISKDEIINAVWDGRFIAEATLTRSMADLRRALGDDQRSPHRDDRQARIPARRDSVAGRWRSVPATHDALNETRHIDAEPSPVVLPFTRPARETPSTEMTACSCAGASPIDWSRRRRWRFVGRDAEKEMFARTDG